MQWRFSRKSDVQVRLIGIGLVLVSALLLTLLPTSHAAAQTSVTTPEFCTAFVAVVCGSFGACLSIVGRALFEPVPDRRERASREDHPMRRDQR